jgi:hypothetical protein
MKKIFVPLVLALAILAVPTASASARTVVDSYCSPSGDYCTGIVREGGRIKFSISTFSFSGDYELTVKRGGECRSSKTFRLRSKPSGLNESKIDFARNFSCGGPGRYSVTWSLQGSQLGPALHMRLR